MLNHRGPREGLISSYPYSTQKLGWHILLRIWQWLLTESHTLLMLHVHKKPCSEACDPSRSENADLLHHVQTQHLGPSVVGPFGNRSSPPKRLAGAADTKPHVCREQIRNHNTEPRVRALLTTNGYGFPGHEFSDKYRF